MSLGISKTFDAGQHNALISKLQKYGVEEESLENGAQLTEETTFTHLLLAISCQKQGIYEVL